MAVRSLQSETVAVPKRIQLVSQFDSRDAGATPDAQLVNAFVEKDPNDGEYWVCKRPGVTGPLVGPIGVPHGLFTIKRSVSAPERILFATTNQLYAGAVGTLIGPLGAFGGFLRFTAVSYSGIAGATRVAVFTGTSGTAWLSDGVSLVAVADPDYPNVRVPGIVYLDSSVYVMTPEGAIYGSGINDPTSWSALNVIQANDQADLGAGIARHLNYIVALKAQSTQLFYNAGNPSGSPLRRVPGASFSTGCANGDSVQDIDGELLWLSSNQGVNLGVAKMSSARITKVSTPAVERLLSAAGVNGWNSFQLKLAGHRFYVLTNSFIDGRFTLVYDLDANLWYRWTSPAGDYWPYFHSTYSYSDLVFGTKPVYYMQAEDGRLHNVAPNYEDRPPLSFLNDGGEDFAVDVYTQDHDFGTQRSKNLGAMFFKGDRVNADLNIRSKDEDGAWTDFSRINLGEDRPALFDCGSFNRRAWHFRHKASTTFRMKTMDLQVDLGTN